MGKAMDPRAGNRVAWAMAAALLALAGCSSSDFDPPERSGPMGLVRHGDGAALWIATTQDEVRQRFSGGSRASRGKWFTESWTHLRVQAHDPATGQRLWLREVLAQKDGVGVSSELRILGQQGDRVWVWLGNSLQLLDAGDGHPVADTKAIEAANPGTAGLFPTDIVHYTSMGDRMVVTLADGRRIAVDGTTLAATDYEVTDRSVFDYASSMTQRWNGGYRTADFGVRHVKDGDAWVGLLSPAEATDAVDDGYGSNHFDSAEIDNEGNTARRGFLRATVGKTTEFREGRLPRLDALEPIPGAAGPWLQGVLLRTPALPGTPAWVQRGVIQKPTPGNPLRLKDPVGLVVMHRTRLDDAGRLALTRVDGDYRERWTATLPLAEISNRWELGDHLLLFGELGGGVPGMRIAGEALVSVDLATGAWQAWDVSKEAALAPSGD